MNTFSKSGESVLEGHERNASRLKGESLLDCIERTIRQLGKEIEEKRFPNPLTVTSDGHYLQHIPQSPYQHRIIKRQVETARLVVRGWGEEKDKWHQEWLKDEKLFAKRETATTLLKEFKELRKSVITLGGKSFQQLHPNIEQTNFDESDDNSTEQEPFDPKVSFQMGDPSDEKPR